MNCQVHVSIMECVIELLAHQTIPSRKQGWSIFLIPILSSTILGISILLRKEDIINIFEPVFERTTASKSLLFRSYFRKYTPVLLFAFPSSNS